MQSVFLFFSAYVVKTGVFFFPFDYNISNTTKRKEHSYSYITLVKVTKKLTIQTF